MFVRRQALSVASRLPATSTRAIAPLVRYSTESSPATSTPAPAAAATPTPPPTQQSSLNPTNGNGPHWKIPSSSSSTPKTEPAPAVEQAASTPLATADQATAAAPKTTHARPKPRAKTAVKPPFTAKPSPRSPPLASRPPSGAIWNPSTAATALSDAPKSADFSHATINAPASVSQMEGLDSMPDINWEQSYYGASVKPVTEEQFNILMRPLKMADIEVKPDGVIYLPEIKYRRRLNEAFGPMGWCLIPRGEAVIGDSIVTREYALIINGRFVSQSQGENNYFGTDQLPSAVEGCKSNALMRCCKDLGIASELWDPIYIRWFKKSHMKEVWVEHQVTKKKRTLWFHASSVEVAYPWKLAQK